MSNNLEWQQMMELIKLKREDPEAYKQLLKDFAIVAKDFYGAVQSELKDLQ